MSHLDAGRLPSLADALQAVLAGENASAYAYGLVGSHVTGTGRDLAHQYFTEHDDARDQVRAWLIERGIEPQPAAAAYEPPFPIGSEKSARALAALVEQRLAMVWADLVGAARLEGQTKLVVDSAAAVSTCAVRASRWSGTTTAFVGPPS